MDQQLHKSLFFLQNVCNYLLLMPIPITYCVFQFVQVFPQCSDKCGQTYTKDLHLGAGKRNHELQNLGNSCCQPNYSHDMPRSFMNVLTQVFHLYIQYFRTSKRTSYQSLKYYHLQVLVIPNGKHIYHALPMKLLNICR